MFFIVTKGLRRSVVGFKHWRSLAESSGLYSQRPIGQVGRWIVLVSCIAAVAGEATSAYAGMPNDTKTLAPPTATTLVGQKLANYVYSSNHRCNPRVVQNLLSRGASPNTLRQKDAESVLDIAAGNGATGCALVLIHAKANVARRDRFGDTALTYAAGSYRCDAVLIRSLIAHGADPNAREGIFGYPAIVLAASNQRIGCVKALLAAGARVNASAPKRPLTALISGQFPVTQGSRERRNMTHLLLSHKADPNARGPHGITALFLAVALAKGLEPCAACAQMLLAAGANANAIDDAGETPLLSALNPKRETNIASLRVLINGGANVNLANAKTGETPLMAAAAIGDQKFVRFLLGVGAKRCTRDKRGRTAADYARSHDRQKIMKLIVCPAAAKE